MTNEGKTDAQKNEAQLSLDEIKEEEIGMRRKNIGTKRFAAMGIGFLALAAVGLTACGTQTASGAANGSSAAAAAAGSTAAQAAASAAGGEKTLAAQAASAAAGADSSTGLITEAQAEEKALAAAGLSRDQVAFIHTEQDREDGGRIVYEVEFYTTDYKEYDYEVNAADGSVLHSDFDAEFYDAAASSKLGRYLNGKPQNQAAQTNPGAFSLDAAKEAAVKHAGLTLADVTFGETKTDRDDGREVYEMEFYTKDRAEYSYEIDTETGDIISYDFDAPDFGGQQAQAGAGQQETGAASHTAGQSTGAAQTQTAAQSGTAVDAEGAKQAALARAGLKADQVSRLNVHEETDDGRREFEGSFVAADREYEFTVDAATGNITDWDEESVHD